MNSDYANLIVGAINLGMALWVTTLENKNKYVKLFFIMLNVICATLNFYTLLKRGM